MFCPHCGNATDILPGAEAAEAPVPLEVQLARIDADRAITIAKIQSRQDANWNETRTEVAEIEADAMVEAAAAEAEILGAAIEASDTPDADPIEIIAPGPADEDEGQGDELPPAEGSPIPAAPGHTRGLGMW